MRRAALVAAAALLLVGGATPVAHAGMPTSVNVVYRVHDVSLGQLLRLGGVRALATNGGVALLAHAERLDAEIDAADGLPDIFVTVQDLGVGIDGLVALDARLSGLAVDPTQATGSCQTAPASRATSLARWSSRHRRDGWGARRPVP